MRPSPGQFGAETTNRTTERSRQDKKKHNRTVQYTVCALYIVTEEETLKIDGGYIIMI